MNSLREEIFEFSKKTHVYPLSDIDIDFILEMIEKRIDSIEEWKNKAKPTPGGFIPDDEDNSNYEYLKAFTDGFEEALKMIRREILKQ